MSTCREGVDAGVFQTVLDSGLRRSDGMRNAYEKPEGSSRARAGIQEPAQPDAEALDPGLRRDDGIEKRDDGIEKRDDEILVMAAAKSQDNKCR